MKYEIINFDNINHRAEVISIWRVVFGYEAEHNAPELVINKKLSFDDGLFFVAIENSGVAGTVMAG